MHTDEYKRQYYAANKERIKQRVKDWRKANPERHAATVNARRKRNPEPARKWGREYDARNRDALNAKTAQRRARHRKATVRWADKNEIEKYYSAAALLTSVLGIAYQVDHIVPLQSDLVCGLHWQGNLRVITAFENQSKSNRHWPDMP